MATRSVVVELDWPHSTARPPTQHNPLDAKILEISFTEAKL